MARWEAIGMRNRFSQVDGEMRGVSWALVTIRHEEGLALVLHDNTLDVLQGKTVNFTSSSLPTQEIFVVLAVYESLKCPSTICDDRGHHPEASSREVIHAVIQK